MIIHIGVTTDPQRIVFYSGLIESLFFLTAFCTCAFSLFILFASHCSLHLKFRIPYEPIALFWGRLSDRIGRRPVILIGIVGIIISAIGIGLSETLVAMIVARCINSLHNSTEPAIRR